MKEVEIIRMLTGSLWELLRDISPEDFIEPVTAMGFAEQVVGTMTELEKALYTIHEDSFEQILISFDKDSDPDQETSDFYYFLLNASREEFLSICDKAKVSLDELMSLRVDLNISYTFLWLVTVQRLEINYDDYHIFYRSGHLVTIQNKNIFNADQH